MVLKHKRHMKYTEGVRTVKGGVFPNQKWRRRITLIRRRAFNVATDFTKETSLHGLRYIGSANEHPAVRVLWAVLVIIGFFFCVFLMILTWRRYKLNPVLTTIGMTNYPNSLIPFPAVTICNENKVYKPAINKIKEILKSNGFNEDSILRFFESIPYHTSTILPQHDEEVSKAYHVLQSQENYNVSAIMQEVSQPCSRMLVECYWDSEMTNCNDIFELKQTVRGFCCVFNNFITDESKGRVKYAAGSGKSTGLRVITNFEFDYYVASSTALKGGRVHIYDPFQNLLSNTIHEVLSAGLKREISLTATVIKSQDVIRDVGIQSRGCAFEDEVTLISTSSYSLNSCKFDYQNKKTLKLCGCLPFYVIGTGSTNIFEKERMCSYDDFVCLNKYYHSLFWIINSNNASETDVSFDCLPACDSVTYTFISEFTEHAEIHLNGHLQYPTNLSSVQIFFSDLTSLMYKRDTIITWDNMIASFGGIFGLCLGGSILSVVELIYYFTVKMLYPDKETSQKTAVKNTNKVLPVEPRKEIKSRIFNVYPEYIARESMKCNQFTIRH